MKSVMNEKKQPEKGYELGLAIGAGKLKFGEKFEIVDLWENKVYSYTESNTSFDIDLTDNEYYPVGYKKVVGENGKIFYDRDTEIIDIFDNSGDLRYIIRKGTSSSE